MKKILLLVLKKVIKLIEKEKFNSQGSFYKKI